jgi:hypothetical protein
MLLFAWKGLPRMNSVAQQQSTSPRTSKETLELSPAKQAALMNCLTNNGLHKVAGAWQGRSGTRISGLTVADLARDGMLDVNKPLGLAQLTEKGLRQAQALSKGGLRPPRVRKSS